MSKLAWETSRSTSLSDGDSKDKSHKLSIGMSGWRRLPMSHFTQVRNSFIMFSDKDAGIANLA